MTSPQTFACNVLHELKALTGIDGAANANADHRDGANIVLEGTGYVIRIILGAGRGEARAFVPAGEGTEANGLDYTQRPMLGQTSFDIDAPAARVAKAIVRRIIEPAKAPIATMREIITAKAAHTLDMNNIVQAYRHLYPTARIVYAPGDTTAGFHMSRTDDKGDYSYIDGSIDERGLMLNRSSRLPAHAATALLGAMFPEASRG